MWWLQDNINTIVIIVLIALISRIWYIKRKNKQYRQSVALEKGHFYRYLIFRNEEYYFYDEVGNSPIDATKTQRFYDEWHISDVVFILVKKMDSQKDNFRFEKHKIDLEETDPVKFILTESQKPCYVVKNHSFYGLVQNCSGCLEEIILNV